MEEFYLKDLFSFFWKKKIKIIVLIIISLCIGLISFVNLKEIHYKTTVTFFDNSYNSNILNDYEYYEKSLLNSYIEIIKSKKIFNRVKAKLDLNMSYTDFYRMLEVSIIPNTSFVKLTVTNNKDNVVDIASSLSTEFFNELETLNINDRVFIIDESGELEQNYNINILTVIFISIITPIVFSFLYYIVIFYFFNKKNIL